MLTIRGPYMREQAENIFPMDEYEHRKALYERQRRIYDDNMHQWEVFNKISLDMDARFDKALFTVAAGSFALSFAFIGNIVPLSKAFFTPVLIASWACFALCLIVMVLGHLLSAEAYRRQRDNVAKNITLLFSDKPTDDDDVMDAVSPCNYISLILYTGGVICLLLFVLLNL
jgi:hypothetical protein